MAEADTEYRDAAPPTANRLDGDPGLCRRTGTRRNHDRRRLEGADLVDGNGVVTTNVDIGAQLAQVLHKVVRERVVIVDHEKHWRLSADGIGGGQRQPRG